jgi:hypothetical protein
MNLRPMFFKVAPESINEHADTRPAREKRDVEALHEDAQSIRGDHDLVYRLLNEFLAFPVPIIVDRCSRRAPAGTTVPPSCGYFSFCGFECAALLSRDMRREALSRAGV